MTTRGNAPVLDRLITRRTLVADPIPAVGQGGAPLPPTPTPPLPARYADSTVWAARRDRVIREETSVTGTVGVVQISYVVRHDGANPWTVNDSIVDNGLRYEVRGIAEMVGRNTFLELICSGVSAR